MLTYHRVADPDPDFSDPSLISATPGSFLRQMEHVARRYTPISLEQLLKALASGERLPRKALLVTFDDAYIDFGEIAWPILRCLGIPATLFVPTAYPADPHLVFWWDRLFHIFVHCEPVEFSFAPEVGKLCLHTPAERVRSLRRTKAYLKSLPHSRAMAQIERICGMLSYPAIEAPSVLDWDRLRTLAKEGVSICGHTRTHPLMNRLSRPEMHAEIRGAQEDIRNEIGIALPVFAYPSGAHNADVLEMLQQEGIKLAFTTLDGHNDMKSADLLRMRRTNITQRTSPALFSFRLLKAGTYVDMARHGTFRQRRTSAALRSNRSGSVRGTANEIKTSPVNSAASGHTPKIAYIVSRFPKLTETFILYEILAMERQLGIKAEIYSLLREKEKVLNPEVRGLMSRAHFERLFSWRTVRANAVCLCNQPGTYVRTLASVLRATWRSRNFLLGVIAFFPKAVSFALDMERLQIKHVHAHFATHSAMAGYVVNRLTGIPFSFTARGSDIHLDRRMLKEKVEAAAFVIAVSSFNRDIIVNECGEHTRDKVHVVFGGIDTETVCPAARLESGKFKIISVGRFEEVKGQKYLVDACAVLRTRGIEFECQLIGEGPLIHDVRRQISSLGLEDYIHISGFRTHKEVIDEVRNSSVAVLATTPTSDGKCEGIPNVLKEAMACAIPVVASKVGGIPELVDDGISGILVPPRDPVAIANAIAALVGDRSMQERMGRAGREKIVREFSLSSSVRRRAELFLGTPPETTASITLKSCVRTSRDDAERGLIAR